MNWDKTEYCLLRHQEIAEVQQLCTVTFHWKRQSIGLSFHFVSFLEIRCWRAYKLMANTCKCVFVIWKRKIAAINLPRLKPREQPQKNFFNHIINQYIFAIIAEQSSYNNKNTFQTDFKTDRYMRNCCSVLLVCCKCEDVLLLSFPTVRHKLFAINPCRNKVTDL